MDIGEKLRELDITSEEVNRFTKAFKDETFRQMLLEYAEEISDPENKKKYEEEMTILEQERGNHVVFIHPEPFRAYRTSVDGKKKCFINICSNEQVAKPECSPGRSEDARRGQKWSLPHSLHPGRQHSDRKGVKHMVYDVVFNPDTLHMAGKNSRFMDMVKSTALQGVQDAFKVTLDSKNVKELKVKYKGTPQPCIIRKPIPGYNAKESQNETFSFPYPEQKLKPTVPQMFEVKPQTTKEPTKPRYDIKYRSYIDMQDYATCYMDSTKNIRPKEIVVTIDVPLLKTVADTHLDIKEKMMLLECEKPSYRLELPLSYPVDGEKGEAKFNRHKGQLTVTLPVLPSPKNVLSPEEDKRKENDELDYRTKHEREVIAGNETETKDSRKKEKVDRQQDSEMDTKKKDIVDPINVNTMLDNMEVNSTKENVDVNLTKENIEVKTMKENKEVHTLKEKIKINTIKENMEVKTMKENVEVKTMKENMEVKTIKENMEVKTMKENMEVKTMKENMEVKTIKENMEVNTIKENMEVKTMKENMEVKTMKENMEVNTIKENMEVKTMKENMEVNTIKENMEVKTMKENMEVKTMKENMEVKTIKENMEVNTIKENMEVKTMKENMEVKTMKENMEVKTIKENMEVKTMKENMEVNTIKENMEVKTMKENMEVKTMKENMEVKTIKENMEVKTMKENMEVKTIKENMEVKTIKENMEVKTIKENMEVKTMKENMEVKTIKENMEVKTMKENMEVKTIKENMEVKTMKENMEVNKIKENVEVKTIKENMEVNTIKKNMEVKTIKENMEVNTMKENMEVNTMKENMEVNTTKERFNTVEEETLKENEKIEVMNIWKIVEEQDVEVEEVDIGETLQKLDSRKERISEGVEEREEPSQNKALTENLKSALTQRQALENKNFEKRKKLEEKMHGSLEELQSIEMNTYVNEKVQTQSEICLPAAEEIESAEVQKSKVFKQKHKESGEEEHGLMEVRCEPSTEEGNDFGAEEKMVIQQLLRSDDEEGHQEPHMEHSKKTNQATTEHSSPIEAVETICRVPQAVEGSADRNVPHRCSSVEDDVVDEDDLPTEQIIQTPEFVPKPPSAILREIGKDGKETIISDHSTSAGFTFQNSLLYELD